MYVLKFEYYDDDRLICCSAHKYILEELVEELTQKIDELIELSRHIKHGPNIFNEWRELAVKNDFNPDEFDVLSSFANGSFVIDEIDELAGKPSSWTSLFFEEEDTEN